MKRLIVVNGPMGVGKTAACRELLELLRPGAYLDGDWCWEMRPFLVTEVTKAMVLDNICGVLNRFLRCEELMYIVFGWVLQQPETLETILSRLDTKGTAVHCFTLLASRDTLRGRLERDIRSGLRTADVVERSLAYLPLYEAQATKKVHTDGLPPREVALRLAQLIRDEEGGTQRYGEPDIQNGD